MSTSNIRGLGIIQDGFTRRWKSTGEVENVRWLEALGSTLAEAMEALQAQARLLERTGSRRGFVRDTGNGFVQRMAIILVMVTLTLFAAGHRPGEAHQDPCHRRHSCPSDHPMYICGDQGCCAQCPDY